MQPAHYLVDPLHRQGAGVHGLASGGLLPKGRNIHVAEIGEHEGARNGRRCHDQHIHRLALFAQRETLMHAETMLLIHHRVSQIAKDHALLKDRVGAHENVDLPCGQRRQRPVAFGDLVASRDEGEADAHALPQRKHALVMLAGENFGGRHERRLPSRLHHARHGQQGDERLARAHIALQQAQHALGRGDVGAYFGDGFRLRSRELEGQGGQNLIGDAPVPHAGAAGQFAKLGAGHHQRHLARQQFIEGEAHAGGRIGFEIPRARGPMQGRQRLREARQPAQ